ncbi:hypothetical protein C3K47_02740 [Solitalea longa]|uniref:Phosphatidic acid phosphatase type 2/haloperoxidase domain-containing protein n=1 Tax=Solitalea longa TaxID=2079460 RepID=A0A2S5A8A7_9SPHI|nr:phosphatase PAP2 family protein [Solitalea longa]POY38333.1 hypothetical protein C3K47_02740 [Solitalea longa]
MFKLYNQHKTYFLLFSIWVIVVGLLIIVCGSDLLFILLHKNLGGFADLFFRLITELVSTIGVTIILILLLFRNWREGIKATIAMISSTIITHSLKIWVDAPRPWVYFKNESMIRTIEGVVLLPNHSFPSGHSTAAFAMAAVLAFTFNDKRLSPWFFIMAVLIAYSRIYLGQHFPLDIYVGSLVGMISASLTWSFVVFKKQKVELN